jgi:hypothetical protein
MIKTSLLEDAVEDALVSILESDGKLLQFIPVRYTEEEWAAVERFHRLRTNKDGKIGLTKDRWPFIQLHALNVTVRLEPYNPVEKPEIH